MYMYIHTYNVMYVCTYICMHACVYIYQMTLFPSLSLPLCAPMVTSLPPSDSS